MAVKSTYRPYKLTQAKRKYLNVSSFGGVDFSSQKFNVATSRAIDEKNFVYKNGVIQKRSGYEQVFQFKEYQYVVQPFDENEEAVLEVHTNSVNVNGMWKFLAEDNKEHYIAHIGKLLYEIKNFGKENMTAEPILYDKEPALIGGSLYNYCYEYEDFKSMAFVGSNRLWFLGGNQFVCIKYDTNSNLILFKVTNCINTGDEKDETYIPITAMGITCKNAIATSRESFEYPNLLTMYRKNLCKTGIKKSETDKTKTEYYEYTLSSPIITKNGEKDMANFMVIIKERGEIE